MSMNYALGFSLFLLILVALNIYFFYTLNAVGKQPSKYLNIGHILNFDRTSATSSVFKDIYDNLNYLSSQYKHKNPKFTVVQRNILQSFNSTYSIGTANIWHNAEIWKSEESLFPVGNGACGQLLHAIRTSQIVQIDNARKGTQLKLALLLENNHTLYFKPKRYDLEHVVKGNIYSGFDRHNSEVFAYYLAMVLNFKWIAPSAIRKIHVNKDVFRAATYGLKKTMLVNGDGSLCIYGKCYYCKSNETVCPDSRGEIEGAAILYLNKQFKAYKSPWRRSYSTRKMDWETDNDFCKKVIGSLSLRRILNLVDVAIFDFLIQNGDRHHYEVYKNKIVLLDNGKGLGNPTVDELDILAPLYQCCMISSRTWHHLELLSGSSLSSTVNMLAAFQKETLATEEHFIAIERRLLKIYATVQYCIGKNGSAKVFKEEF